MIGEVAGRVKGQYEGVAEFGVWCMVWQCVAVCWVYKSSVFESMVGESMAGVHDQTPLAKNWPSVAGRETETVIIANNRKGLPLRSLHSETPTPDRDMLPAYTSNGDDMSANCLHNSCRWFTALAGYVCKRACIDMVLVHRSAYQTPSLLWRNRVSKTASTRKCLTFDVAITCKRDLYGITITKVSWYS